jgi:hypothetical protein
MTPDEVIDLRRLWAKYNYAHNLVEPTVLATENWLNYVQAMAASMPKGDTIAFPTVKDVRWSWPDGVMIVFSDTVQVNHTIISKESVDGTTRKVPAHSEIQECRALMLGPSFATDTVFPDGSEAGSLITIPTLWIGDDASDVVTGFWTPGTAMMSDPVMGEISHSTRLLVSFITALGHRLTRMDEAEAGSRGERRRMQRELPELRVLRLQSGASVKRNDEAPGKVDWQHQWIVKGFWRQQPYGPKSSLRRLQYIDDFVKGPEDKPFDDRKTIWRTP